MHINANETFFEAGEDVLPAGFQPTITLLLDRSQRIVFAGSGIQAWLGYDYETLPGLPMATLIPDLLSFPEWKKICLDRTRKSHQPWSMFAFACHADGRQMPVVVARPSNSNTLSALTLRLTPIHYA